MNYVGYADLLKFDLLDSENSNAVPSVLSVYSAIPCVVVLVLSLLASALFIRYYWKSREHDRPAAVIATLGLWIALLTAFLLPVDVFIVSFMKYDNGTFKEWAKHNSTRLAIESGVAYAYYALYGTILLFVFFLLPLVYFAHEEQDEDQPVSSKRFVSALKYTVVFVVACLLLFFIGAFIPYQKARSSGEEKWVEEVKRIFERMYDDKLTEGLLFVLNVLIFIGMIILIIYLGVGLSLYPVVMIRGWRSLTSEKRRLEAHRNTVSARIAQLRARENTLSSGEKRVLSQLEEEQHLIARMEDEISRESSALWYKLRYFFRGGSILVGLVGAIVGFLVWLAVLLSNINRLLHSLGYNMGYFASLQSIFNPLDEIMMKLQTVFPLDYVMFFGLVLFLVCCTVAGVRYMGIWCFCIRLFKIRPHRTQPQALIMLCAIVMFTVLSLNILIHSAAPQYMTFGNQDYIEYNETSGTQERKECTFTASKDECVMTRASTFILDYAIKAWVFGVCYFWMTWAFLVMVVVSFLVAIIQKKRSAVEEAVDRDDFEESDSDVAPLVP